MVEAAQLHLYLQVVAVAVAALCHQAVAAAAAEAEEEEEEAEAAAAAVQPPWLVIWQEKLLETSISRRLPCFVSFSGSSSGHAASGQTWWAKLTRTVLAACFRASFSACGTVKSPSHGCANATLRQIVIVTVTQGGHGPSKSAAAIAAWIDCECQLQAVLLTFPGACRARGTTAHGKSS